ncbi:twin-arginine translocation signal domain-containing protein [Dyella sp.]|uniref:twin-arginine translocation signal domain-containing protein n=1 Tax=Dyella sp. TaxID=1869338 RepID=UPI003F802431
MTSLDRIVLSRRTLLKAALAATLLPGCLPAALGWPSKADALDAFVLAQMQAAHMPGLAIGLAQDGLVRLVRGYGYADVASHRRVDGAHRIPYRLGNQNGDCCGDHATGRSWAGGAG